MFELTFARGSVSGVPARRFLSGRGATGRATVWEWHRKLVSANATPVKISKESKAVLALARFDEIYHSSSFSRVKTCGIVKGWSLTRRARPRNTCRRSGKMGF